MSSICPAPAFESTARAHMWQQHQKGHTNKQVRRMTNESSALLLLMYHALHVLATCRIECLEIFRSSCTYHYFDKQAHNGSDADGEQAVTH